MTDPDEITQAWREHLAEEAAKRPSRTTRPEPGSIADQVARYRELDEHAALAGDIAIGKMRGTYLPSEHVNEQKHPPLTVAEHLELLALGEPSPGITGTRPRSTRPSRPGPAELDRGRHRDHRGRRPVRRLPQWAEGHTTTQAWATTRRSGARGGRAGCRAAPGQC